MITTQRLIEQADFVQFTDLSQYLQPQYVNVHIIPTQEMSIRPLLGDALYDELISQVESGYPDADYQTLHDYVKPILAYKATGAYITASGLYSTNSGIRVLTTEDSTPASNAEKQGLVAMYNSRAEIYEVALRKYLEANKTTFPLYTQKCGDQNNNPVQISAVIKPTASRQRVGWRNWGYLN